MSVHWCHFYFSCLFCKLLLEIRPLKDNLPVSRWERTSTGQQLVKRSIFFHAAKLCEGVFGGGTGVGGEEELPSFHFGDLEKFFLVCFEWPWKKNLSHIGGTFI